MDSPTLRLPLVPRTVDQCLDFGLRLFSHSLSGVLRLWLLFAIPCCVLVWIGASSWDWSLGDVLLLVLGVTGPLGTILVAVYGPVIYGESFSLSRLVNRFDRLAPALTLSILGRGIIVAVPLTGMFLFESGSPGRGLLICLGVLLGILVTVWQSFLPETQILVREEPGTDRALLTGLVRSVRMDMLGRLMLTSLWYLTLTGIVFITVDMGAELLIGQPIWWGRVQEIATLMNGDADLIFETGWEFLTKDPLVLTTLTATMLLTYPMTRLGWMMFFFDIRIRRDCWDLELAMAAEAKRLRSEHRPGRVTLTDRETERDLEERHV